MKNGQMQIRIDFQDLLKACPKDDFSVPYTDLLVGATAGYEALNSWSNQIKMHLEDKQMATFHSPKGV